MTQFVLDRASGRALRLAWPKDVLAIQTWQRMNRVGYVAVHYRSAGGPVVATCWEQNGHEEMVAFVRERAGAITSRRETVTLAGLRDRAIWSALLKRFVLDVAVASAWGFVLGIVDPAFLLGIAAASVSTLFASSRYSLRPTSLVLKDGLWWDRGANGADHALRAVPLSLRFWVNSLVGNRA